VDGAGVKHEFTNLGDASLVETRAKALRVMLLEKDNEKLWVPRKVLAGGSKLDRGERTGKLIVLAWWADKLFAEWERRMDLSERARIEAHGRPALVAKGASIGGQRLSRKRKRMVGSRG
jgi:hypothetical protein